MSWQTVSGERKNRRRVLTARRQNPGLQNKILQTVTDVERYQGLTGSDKISDRDQTPWRTPRGDTSMALFISEGGKICKTKEKYSRLFLR